MYRYSRIHKNMQFLWKNQNAHNMHSALHWEPFFQSPLITLKLCFQRCCCMYLWQAIHFQNKMHDKVCISRYFYHHRNHQGVAQNLWQDGLRLNLVFLSFERICRVSLSINVESDLVSLIHPLRFPTIKYVERGFLERWLWLIFYYII